MNDTWAQRCCICGDYARGHGQAPEFPNHWVCGLCALEEQEAEHVLVDQRRYSTACHFEIVDLDIAPGDS